MDYDYMLPSDDMMKKMAEEYAKIKRIGIPQRAAAFAFDDMPQINQVQKVEQYVDMSPKKPKNSDEIYEDMSPKKLRQEN